MRIGVHQHAAGEQAAGRIDRGDHRLVGIAGLAVRAIDRPAGKQRHLRQVVPVRADRVRHRQTVRLAEFEIVGAMPRGDVHEARALLAFDETGRQQRDIELIAVTRQRVARNCAGKRRSGEACEDRTGLDAGAPGDLLGECGGEEQGLARHYPATFCRPVDAQRDVIEPGAERDRAIARQGPGRRRPDHRRGTGERRVSAAGDREADPDGGGAMVVILDFRLGQRRLLNHRPEHRFRTLVEPAIDEKLADLPHDLRLGRMGQRRIRVQPIADYSEPSEFVALHADPVLGELAAFAAEPRDRNIVFRHISRPVLFLDHPFDRQTVAVPARYIGRILAEHLLRSAHDVF